MSDQHCTLITLDYPPARGGVAVYLHALVKESNGEMGVVVAEPRRWWNFVPLCHRQKHPVVVSHIFPVGTAAWVSRCFGGPKYAVIFHGLDVRLIQGWKKWLARRIIGGASAVVANSDHTRRDIRMLASHADIAVITPAVEGTFPSRADARKALGIAPDEDVVVSVSRLVPRKGIDFSLRAISRLQTHRPITYTVIGDGADFGRLETVAAECRVHVRWIRDASDETKRLWLAASDVFLLPARDEGHDVEGFGIVYLEAALAGIPSVAGRSGGATEAVRHERTGLVVNPNSIQDIAEAVQKLLDDRGLNERLGRVGKERVEKEFQWKQRWDKLASILGLR